MLGDFCDSKIRQVNGTELLRFDDGAFMPKLQMASMLLSE